MWYHLRAKKRISSQKTEEVRGDKNETETTNQNDGQSATTVRRVKFMMDQVLGMTRASMGWSRVWYQKKTTKRVRPMRTGARVSA